MPKFILILLFALLFEAVGVVFLSAGLKDLNKEEGPLNKAKIVRLIKRGATNKSFLVGVLFEAIFFGFLCFLLAREDVSLIWPLTALGFVFTAISAKLFLHEEVSWVRWIGISLIVIGAGITTYSEKVKEKKTETPAITTP
jgi:drug/metabolite transporter (DMT)-like permease